MSKVSKILNCLPWLLTWKGILLLIAVVILCCAGHGLIFGGGDEIPNVANTQNTAIIVHPGQNNGNAYVLNADGNYLAKKPVNDRTGSAAIVYNPSKQPGGQYVFYESGHSLRENVLMPIPSPANGGTLIVDLPGVDHYTDGTSLSSLGSLIVRGNVPFAVTLVDNGQDVVVNSIDNTVRYTPKSSYPDKMIVSAPGYKPQTIDLPVTIWTTAVKRLAAAPASAATAYYQIVTLAKGDDVSDEEAAEDPASESEQSDWALDIHTPCPGAAITLAKQDVNGKKIRSQPVYTTSSGDAHINIDTSMPQYDTIEVRPAPGDCHMGVDQQFVMPARGTVSTINIALQKRAEGSDGDITLRIMGAGGKELTGATLYVQLEGSNDYVEVVTDYNGRGYYTYHVPAGKNPTGYRVSASGYDDSQSVNIAKLWASAKTNGLALNLGTITLTKSVPQPVPPAE